MQFLHPLGHLRTHSRPDPRLHKIFIICQIDLRDAGRGRKPPLIVGVVAAHGFDVVEGALLAPHDPIPSSKLYVSGIGCFGFKRRFVKPRREYINEVDIT